MKKISEKESEKDALTPLQPEEPGYDLTEVGDAALLAVLGNSDGNIASQEEDSDEEDSRSSQDSQLSQDSQSSPKSQSSRDSRSVGKEAPASPSMAAKLLRLASAILSGEIPEEDLLPLMDAANAREAIENARREGEVAGRNALIEERLKPADPGIPNLCGAAPAGKGRPASIFDIAAGARAF